MRIESVWFGSGIYERMARVFLATAHRHCPDWQINLRQIDEVDLPRHRAALPSHAANTQKMEAWNAIVQGSADGERILLIDSDTFFVNSVSDVWEREFDIAYTVKEESRFPFNSGVVFVRVSPQVKAFFEAWAEENRAMLVDASRHSPWRHRYGGINQAAFGRMLKSEAAEALNIVGLPCQEWNCEDASWASFDPAVTRIVHVKSALRRAIFNGCPLSACKWGVKPLVDLWCQIEAEEVACPSTPLAS